MRKITILLIFSVFSMVVFLSCGTDGKDGECSISHDWEYYDSEWGVYAFEDNNPSTPSTVQKNVFYDSEPGTYTFTYWSEDYSYYYEWSGNYRLEKDLGTEASLFVDGEDGEDRNYELYMSVSGTTDLTYKDSNMDSCLIPPNSDVLNLDFSDSEVENFNYVQSYGYYRLIVDMEMRRIKKQYY